MLVIRQQQMRALGGWLREAFVRRCEAHLRSNFATCAALPAEDLRAMVEEGIARAASYGIDAERDVCKFLNLVAVFGKDFDRNLDWAREMLASDAGPRLRLNRLYARAIRVADAETEAQG
jgi:hypothetical protein